MKAAIANQISYTFATKAYESKETHKKRKHNNKNNKKGLENCSVPKESVYLSCRKHD